MDKLRAMHYLMAAAEHGSFSGAARKAEVSVTAVVKMITALERDLGVQLVQRSPQGLQLTGAGAAYLQACTPLLRELSEIEEQTRVASNHSSGTVVVAVQQVIARECLEPSLPRFYALYPEIRLDVHDFNSGEDLRQGGVDMFLAMGWPQADELIHRRVGAARFVVLASPEYWHVNGLPRRPSDLARHNCLVIRALDRTVMDLWAFERDGVRETVAVRGCAQVSNAHRDLVIELAVKGVGVVRMLDWTTQPRVRAGQLVPALNEWTSPEAIPVNLLYRPSARRVTRIRKVIDFVHEIFEEMTSIPGNMASDQPHWLNRHHGRSSLARSGR